MTVPGAVPDEVRARSALTRIDYADHFTLPTPRAAAGADRWALALFGDRPDLAERFIWQVLLGLRLRNEVSSDVVAGWPVTARGEDWLRMATASRWMSVELVVTADEDLAHLTTLVRYDRLRGGWLWRPLSAVHRALAPGLLRDADARLEGQRTTR